MNKYLEDVRKFQNIFHDFNSTTPTTEVSDKDKTFRIALIQEEFDELKEAIAQNDLIEIADALADLQYLLFGTVLTFGLQNHFEDIFNEVHRSNMTKLPPDGKIIYREDGKIIKPPTFEQPKIKEILNPKLEKGKIYRFKEGEWKNIDLKVTYISPEECYTLGNPNILFPRGKNVQNLVSTTLNKDELWRVYEYKQS